MGWGRLENESRSHLVNGEPEKYPVLVLGDGDRRRKAAVTGEVLKSRSLIRSVLRSMRQWPADEPPFSMLYAWGEATLEDGSITSKKLIAISLDAQDVVAAVDIIS